MNLQNLQNWALLFRNNVKIRLCLAALICDFDTNNATHDYIYYTFEWRDLRKRDIYLITYLLRVVYQINLAI